MGFGFPPSDRQPTLGIKFVSAGLGACVADLITFPLDVAKVRLQVQGGGVHGDSALLQTVRYRGVAGTLLTIAREEGPRALYGGLVAGLQRQVCFASVRIGLYDTVRDSITETLKIKETSSASILLVRIMSGLATGGIAVVFAQPTDVVKVRMQAESGRYAGCMEAYKRIGRFEGVKGLWKGTTPNIARTAIVNASEVVTYDILKSFILNHQLMSDRMPCHFTAAFGAGFITTIVASPVDVVKTRFMNSPKNAYRNVIECAVRTAREEGAMAFYKGFWPSFLRLSSWNVCMFVSMEQFKRAFLLLKSES